MAAPTATPPTPRARSHAGRRCGRRQRRREEREHGRDRRPGRAREQQVEGEPTRGEPGRAAECADGRDEQGRQDEPRGHGQAAEGDPAIAPTVEADRTGGGAFARLRLGPWSIGSRAGRATGPRLDGGPFDGGECAPGHRHVS